MVCTSSGTNDRRCRASSSSLVSWLEHWSLTFCAWCVLEFDHQITFTMQKLIRLLNSIRSRISTKSPLFMSRLTATLFWVQFSEKGAHPQFLVRLSSEHITIVCVMRWWIVIRNEWVGTLHCTVTNTHSDYTMEFQKSSDRPSVRSSNRPTIRTKNKNTLHRWRRAEKDIMQAKQQNTERYRRLLSLVPNHLLLLYTSS